MSNRKRLVSDELWAEISALLPPRNNPHPRGGGRKPKDDRLVFEAILFVLRFSCQWNALNATGMCPSSTVHDRFTKWNRVGFFQRLRDAGLLNREALRHIDWSWLSGDSDKAAPGRRIAAQTPASPSVSTSPSLPPFLAGSAAGGNRKKHSPAPRPRVPGAPSIASNGTASKPVRRVPVSTASPTEVGS